MAYRRPLVLDRWLVKTRTLALGAQRLYMSLIEREATSVVVGPGKTPVGVGTTNKALLRQFPYTDTVLPEAPTTFPEDFLDTRPVPGDLIVVKCDLQFATSNSVYPKTMLLPDALNNLFIMVELTRPTIKKLVPEFFALLSLNVYKNIESFLDLTEEDHEHNISDTKIWDRSDHGGFRQRDYIRKRDWLANRSIHETGNFQTDCVEFHSMVWRENDLLTSIPGMMETRREKHWFLDNWNPAIYKSFKDITGETMLKFPLVGVVGTLLEVKVVTHGYAKHGEYMGGNTHQTIFYKVLFRDRTPVWVDAPIWKCPDPLSVPIFLPIP